MVEERGKGEIEEQGSWEKRGWKGRGRGGGRGKGEGGRGEEDKINIDRENIFLPH